MATTAQMIAAGIAFIANTVVLIYAAFIGDQTFQPIVRWVYSFQYGREPPFDPGMLTWVFPLFFMMLIGMWFALLFSLYYMSISKSVQGYEIP